MTDSSANEQRLVDDLVRAFVDGTTRPGVTDSALSDSTVRELAELTDRIEAFATNPTGRAIASFWMASNSDAAAHVHAAVYEAGRRIEPFLILMDAWMSYLCQHLEDGADTDESHREQARADIAEVIASIGPAL
jgi:hypothetical protein